MTSTVELLGRAEYVALTTFRADGRAVTTPVWAAERDGRLVMWPPGRSAKARRIRRTPHVAVAVCDFSGELRGPAGLGSARLLPRAEHRAARRALAASCGRRFHWLPGSMLLLSYLAPFVRELSGTGPDSRALPFAISGVAGMLGVWRGGPALDRVGPDRSLLIGIAGLLAAMAVFAGVWFVRPVPFWLVVPLAAVWGGFVLELDERRSTRSRPPTHRRSSGKPHSRTCRP